MKLGTITQDHTDKQFYRLIRHFKKEKRKLGKDYSNGLISLCELSNRLVLIRIMENLIQLLCIDYLPTISLHIEQGHQFIPLISNQLDKEHDLNIIMDCLLEQRGAPMKIWEILEETKKEQSKDKPN